MIEKILERLKEEREIAEKELEKCIFKGLPYHDSTEGKIIGIKEAIEIVQEVVEEYNNGWIACSDRLPEEATSYQVTEEVVVNSTKQYIVDIRLFGTEGEWLCPSNIKIIAWQPLPKTYQPKGE